jgi:cytochrome c2
MHAAQANRHGIHLSRRQLLPILNHALASVLLIIVAGFELGRPVWHARKSLILVVGLFAGAYFVSALGLAWTRPHPGRAGLLRIILSGLAAFGIAFMAFAFAEWRLPGAFREFPLQVPLVLTALGMAMLVASNWASEVLDRKFDYAVPLLLLAAIAAAWFASGKRPTPTPTQEISYLNSSLYVVKKTAYRNWIRDGSWRGGAIAAFEEGYLLASGRGALYFVVEHSNGKSLVVRPLPLQVPFNPEDFSLAGHAAFPEEWTDNPMGERLRVADLLVEPRAGGVFRIFVSHHYWKKAENCSVVRVSMVEGSRRELLEGGNLGWRTVFESTPCLALNVQGHRGGRFGGLQIGGAMALVGENQLILTIGDHEFDGWTKVPQLPQDPAATYGKILQIEIDTGKYEMYSLGHRNPEGLYLDPTGNLWSTEHGPRGGDELNLIHRGANYGWPLVTYGTEYWLHYWPPDKNSPGRHDGFEKPILAFVPSIAVSTLTGVTGNLFAAWRGDLLLVSLKGDLKRVRIEDGRAIFVEPFVIGGRLRHIAEGRDGKIAMLADNQDLIFLEPGDADSPEALVFQCAACHTFGKGERGSIGPNLNRVVGRRVASAKGYEYSQAMKNFGGRWTPARLDQFLADPAGTVPGTAMQFEGVKDPAQREKIIQFLKVSH